MSRRNAAFEVICIRDMARGIAGKPPRGGLGRGDAKSSSVLDGMLRDGRAEMVFNDGARGPLSTSSGREQEPEFVSVAAKDESEARDLLDQLNRDQPDSTVYVAPPRHILARTIGPRHSSSATPVRRHWGRSHINVPDALSSSKLSVKVGVVDTGADVRHPDLAGAIEHYENFTRDSDDDQDGHGSHVCGIIAATGDLNVGMKGVCNVGLHVFKGLGKRYNATEYYRALRAACHQTPIVNLSLGGVHFDPGEETIIAGAIRRGVVVVAAMGNEFDNGNETYYPAALSGVIAVGAVNPDLSHAAFSNSGQHIALVAPGVDIWSTVPTYRTRLFGAVTGYAPCDGTSMAAPFVSGVAALLAASASSQLDVQAVRDRIPVTFCPHQDCITEELGAGVLHWPGPLLLGTAPKFLEK